MEKGEVQFGILAPPFDLIAEKRGYEMLLALPGLGIPWQQNGELVPASYLKSNRDNVVRLLRATAEAEKFYFDQKEQNTHIINSNAGPIVSRGRKSTRLKRRWKRLRRIHLKPRLRMPPRS
ncbi:MAG: hypothetical protein E6J73_03100 [Deltaproteobacteria bacterium]|nr:MAG: hypothetical protein E6J73_03100 [Deltaproteobacteria bacterium]